MAYGTYDRMVVDSSNDDHGMASAIDMGAATGVILLKTIREPRTVARFGYMPTVELQYQTKTTEGVLTVYKYPLGVAASKVALGTIALKDAAAAFVHYGVDLDNQPVAATAPYQGVADLGLCDLQPGDQVAIWITTQAVGSSYLAGAFQPFLDLFKRAEANGCMTGYVDLTPVKTAVSDNSGLNKNPASGRAWGRHP